MALPGSISKAAWRRQVRRTRSEPDPEVSAALQDNLLELLGSIPGTILFYRSMLGEVPLEPVAEALGWNRFAVTRTPEEGPLTVHPAIGPMEQHPYGFAQPVPDALELPPHHLSAVVVPGLAFDRDGTRLGNGAGYFDKLLARVPSDRPRIGITVDPFLVEHLPAEPHDVPMTHIVTDLQIFEVGSVDDDW